MDLRHLQLTALYLGLEKAGKAREWGLPPVAP